MSTEHKQKNSSPGAGGCSPRETSRSPDPSHIMTGEYAALMETNGKECESWYYFIRRHGNHEALEYLQEQLEKVDWYVMDDLSVFELDLEHFVSAKTAKQMTKLELNSYAFHRKFDGKLGNINLGFRSKDDNERMMCKTFDQLGYGQIEDFIADEDLDPEDLTEGSSSSESDSESDSEGDSKGGSTDDESVSASDDETKKSETVEVAAQGVPPALLNSDRPQWTRHKGKRNRNRKKR